MDGGLYTSGVQCYPWHTPALVGRWEADLVEQQQLREETLHLGRQWGAVLLCRPLSWSG